MQMICIILHEKKTSFSNVKSTEQEIWSDMKKLFGFIKMLKYDEFRLQGLFHEEKLNCVMQSCIFLHFTVSVFQIKKKRLSRNWMCTIPNALSRQSLSDQLWVEGVLSWENSLRPLMVITTLAAVSTQHSRRRENWRGDIVTLMLWKSSEKLSWMSAPLCF